MASPPPFVLAASSGLFSILHAQPLLGRVYLDGDVEPGRDHEVVLSYELWRSHFAGNPAIVGTNIQLNGEAFTVVGVMKPGFSFPLNTDPADRPLMWKPLAWSGAERAIRDDHNYGVIARFKPGVSLQQARADLDTISNQLALQYPKDDKGWGATAILMRDDLVGDVRPALLILLGAVAFVLLIACANVANLVLARTLSRRKEVAIRAALGASRGRLAATGVIRDGTAGHCRWRAGADFRPLWHDADREVSGATTAASQRDWAGWLGAGIYLGHFAADRIRRRTASGFAVNQEDVNQALKQGLGRTASDSSGARTRSVLVVTEVALSLMLLIGAGLLIRSLWILRNVNPGFDANRVLTMDLAIPQTKFASPEQQVSFFQRVLDRVRTLPGVQSAGVIDCLPLSAYGSHQPVQVEGRAVVPMADQPEVDMRTISPGYFSAMHIPLLRGRDFNDSDVAGRPGAVLISQSMAKEFWPNQDPIGKHVDLYFFPGVQREVVGVVGDVKLDSLNQTRPTQAMYLPLAQLSAARGEDWHSYGMSLAVRTNIDPQSAVLAITNSVHQVDSDVPLLNIKTMDDSVAESLSPQRFTMLLLAGFAGLALLLAAVGIYSVLAYAVRRRLREIGIRMALGAQINDVLRMVVLEGMKPTLLGVLIGLVGALALGRVLSSVIYGVSARDLATFSTVAVVMTGVGLLASTLPAYRATKVDPMKTLREE